MNSYETFLNEAGVADYKFFQELDDSEFTHVFFDVSIDGLLMCFEDTTDVDFETFLQDYLVEALQVVNGDTVYGYAVVIYL